jgi:hypothetical protein
MKDRGMRHRKHKPEEIVTKLRQVDVLVSQAQSVAEAVRSIGVPQFNLISVEQRVWLPEDEPGEATEGAGEGERTAAEVRVRPHAGESDPSRPPREPKVRISEASEPRPSRSLRRPRHAEVQCLGTLRLPSPWPASIDPDQCSATPSRRGGSHP